MGHYYCHLYDFKHVRVTCRKIGTQKCYFRWKMESYNSSVSPDFLSNSTSLLLVTPSVVRKATFRSANVAFHQLFNFYLMALVLVIGVIANGIIVIVMRDVSFRKLPLSVYFTTLALSDAITRYGSYLFHCRISISEAVWSIALLPRP